MLRHSLPALGLATFLLLDTLHATAGFVYVDPSGVTPGGQAAYTTIQAAINAAPVGSSIIVDAGRYSENVTISQQGITLEGAQAGVNPFAGRAGPESILDGTITINSANVTIDGFTVTANAQWAVEVGGANAPSLPAINSVIKNNIITDPIYGVQIGAEGIGPYVPLVPLYSLVQNNVVGNITLFHTSNNTVQGNFVSGHPGGIEVYYANDNSILSNRVDDGGVPAVSTFSAIRLRGAIGNVVENNYGYDDGQPAIQAYEGSSNNTILNNDLSPNDPPSPVPEPASALLLLVGLPFLGLAARASRRQRTS